MTLKIIDESMSSLTAVRDLPALSIVGDVTNRERKYMIINPLAELTAGYGAGVIGIDMTTGDVKFFKGDEKVLKLKATLTIIS